MSTLYICIFFLFRMNDNLTKRKWKDYLYIHEKNADICCPSCDFKTKGKDEFIRHSLEEHYDCVIEECDSIEFFGSKALQGKIIPKTPMQRKKE